MAKMTRAQLSLLKRLTDGAWHSTRHLLVKYVTHNALVELGGEICK